MIRLFLNSFTLISLIGIAFFSLTACWSYRLIQMPTEGPFEGIFEKPEPSDFIVPIFHLACAFFILAINIKRVYDFRKRSHR